MTTRGPKAPPPNSTSRARGREKGPEGTEVDRSRFEGWDAGRQCAPREKHRRRSATGNHHEAQCRTRRSASDPAENHDPGRTKLPNPSSRPCGDGRAVSAIWLASHGTRNGPALAPPPPATWGARR